MGLQVCHVRAGAPTGPHVALAFSAYDGLHCGHVRLIEQTLDHARRLGLPSAVLSFEPNPRRLLDPHTAAFALVTRDQEVRALERLGVERLYVLSFDAALLGMDHAAFAREVLHDTLQVRHLVAPDPVVYGNRREGNAATLAEAGRRHGFGVSFVREPPGALGVSDQEAVIRKRVMEGRMAEAADLLGRPFAIEGPVQHGAKLGRTIGFPTANISLGDYVRPAPGIYASVSQLADGRRLPSLSYIGRRPTVDDGEARLEVFLFDMDEDIYGQLLETALIERIRPDEKFETLAAMQRQMQHDRETGYPIAAAWRDRDLFLR